MMILSAANIFEMFRLQDNAIIGKHVRESFENIFKECLIYRGHKLCS